MCSVHSQLETGSLSQFLYEDNDLGTKTKGSNGEKNTWCEQIPCMSYTVLKVSIEESSLLRSLKGYLGGQSW